MIHAEHLPQNISCVKLDILLYNICIIIYIYLSLTEVVPVELQISGSVFTFNTLHVNTIISMLVSEKRNTNRFNSRLKSVEQRDKTL